jgi:hypothetical protein
LQEAAGRSLEYWVARSSRAMTTFVCRALQICYQQFT